MTSRKSPALRGLALAVACLTAACATPSLTAQDSRALRTQTTENGDAAIVLKELDLTLEGTSLDLEASEAILALTNPTPAALSVRAIFEGTTRSGDERHVASLESKTLVECGIRPYRKLTPVTPRRALRSLEAPAAPSLEATMSFTLGSAVEFETFPVPQASRVYDGEHCVIYLDDRDTEWLTPEAAEELGERFDTQTYPTLTASFGSELSHPGDDFNYGQDRTIFLFTRELANSMPGSAGMVDMLDMLRPELFEQDGLHSNYAKMIYMLPQAISPMTPGTMAHEFVHVLFSAKRQRVYSEVHGQGAAFGWDPSYYDDGQTYYAEAGINEGLGELGKFIAGYSPDDMPIAAERIARYLGQPQIFDLLEFYGPAGTNYGGMGLFSSYLYGRDGSFPRKLLTAQATGSAAIAEALGQDFPGLYRDFTLAMALDGLAPQVPPRYQIPMINLHATYDTGTGLLPLRGANDSTAPLTLTAPRPHGVRFTRVRFPNGKGKLTISGDPQLKASLILLDPARPQGFVED